MTSFFFVGAHIAHPFWMLAFLVLTAVGFSLLGFIIGLWAKNFEQLQIIPLMVITPLVFLGGAFYSASMLPEPWNVIARFNPVLHLIGLMRRGIYVVYPADYVSEAYVVSLSLILLASGLLLSALQWR